MDFFLCINLLIICILKIDWNKVGAIATIIGTILSGIGIILSITSNNQLNINVNLNMNKVHIENINE